MARKSNFPRPILPLDIWGPVPANQPPRDDEYNEELDEEFRQSNIHRNRLESEKLQREINLLKLQEEIEKEKFRNSPEGKRYIRERNQRYDDQRFYVREKSYNFLIRRPIELIKNTFSEDSYQITYKHYISIIYILLMMTSAVISLGIIGLFVGIFGCILLVLAFNLVRFEVGFR